MINKKIKGGATIWARQTIDSDIFFWRPDKWFKIWFFIVNKVNHCDTKSFKRGSSFMTYEEISQATKSSKNQIDSFIRYAKKQTMINTEKTTRGMIVFVLKYDIFQDLDNYKTDTETETELANIKGHFQNIEKVVKIADTKTETQVKKIYNDYNVDINKLDIKTDTGTETQPKHNRNTTDTINKNDKNEKNESISSAEKSAGETTSPTKESSEPPKEENPENFPLVENLPLAGESKTPAKSEGAQVNEILGIFYEVNKAINFARPGKGSEREAAANLLKELGGIEETKKIVYFALSVQTDKFAPVITTPKQLWNKLADFKVYYQRKSTVPLKGAVMGSEFRPHVLKKMKEQGITPPNFRENLIKSVGISFIKPNQQLK